MKSVMISIKPKWCELIANGKKTIELRKTKPKIETPFKCYIYCTKGEIHYLSSSKGVAICLHDKEGGKAIGEFVCDAVIPISIEYSNPKSRIALKEFPYTCLTDKQIMDYLGNGGKGYGWHISDLKIYDSPKELNEFRKPCISPEMPYCPACKVGREYISESEAEFYRIDGTCDTEWVCLNYIKRPPQSWCYVENFEG